jgi:hypothetical protein
MPCSQRQAGRCGGIDRPSWSREATPPVIAALIAADGYPAALAVAAVLPLIAAALVPVAALDVTAQPG